MRSLAVTYSCMRMHTTIGAAAFHFRVRDGIGWDHSAMAARERVEAARGAGLKLVQEFLAVQAEVALARDKSRVDGLVNE